MPGPQSCRFGAILRGQQTERMKPLVALVFRNDSHVPSTMTPDTTCPTDRIRGRGAASRKRHKILWRRRRPGRPRPQNAPFCHAQRQNLSMLDFGRGGEIRTHDPLYPKQVRYQTAPRPDLTPLIAPCGQAAQAHALNRSGKASWHARARWRGGASRPPPTDRSARQARR